MVIPPDSLEPDTLRRVLEEIVSRDGTDLTDVEVKVGHVLRQLRAGAVELHYDEEEQSTSLVVKRG